MVAEFGKRGVPLIASGDIWDGKLHYAYFGTESVIGTTLEAYRLPDGPMPDPDEWFPAPTPGA